MTRSDQTEGRPRGPKPPRRLRYLPLPDGGTLTPEAARTWLRDELGEWIMVVSHGAAVVSGRLRELYALLGEDVRAMAEAAVEAAFSGAPVALEREHEIHTLACMAEILASEGEAFGHAARLPSYQILGRELASRLRHAA